MNNVLNFGDKFNYNQIGKRKAEEHLLKSYGVSVEKGGQGSGRHEGQGYSLNKNKQKAEKYSKENKKKELEKEWSEKPKVLKEPAKGYYEVETENGGIEYHKQNIHPLLEKAEFNKDSVEKGGQGSGRKSKIDQEDNEQQKILHSKEYNDLMTQVIAKYGGSPEDYHDNIMDQLMTKRKDNLKKSFEALGVDSIEKSEGSKGGKIIGHTKSGKPIYNSHNSPSEAYGKFTKQDHLDAAALHDQEMNKYSPKNGVGADKFKKHSQERQWHQGEADNFIDNKND